MKNYIINGIKSVIVLLLLTAVCHYLYAWNHLDKVFGPKVTYEQWMAILVIVQTMIPTRDLFSPNKKEGNDE
jgi:hypothetical protein